MANNCRTNPMVIDTGAGAMAIGTATELTIQAIAINASGDNWSVVLKDGAANIIFQATHPLPNDRFKMVTFTVPIKTTGLEIDTLTSITNILIYTVPS